MTAAALVIAGLLLIAAAIRIAMLRAEVELWKRIAAREQQVAGELADEATKWRLSRAARIRRDANRAQAQRAPIRAKLAELREGGE